MVKPSLVKLAPPPIPDDAVKAVGRVLEGNYPMVMVARRPNGEWECTLFLPPNIATYEMIGALEQCKLHLLDGEDRD